MLRVVTILSTTKQDHDNKTCSSKIERDEDKRIYAFDFLITSSVRICLIIIPKYVRYAWLMSNSIETIAGSKKLLSILQCTS